VERSSGSARRFGPWLLGLVASPAVMAGGSAGVLLLSVLLLLRRRRCAYARMPKDDGFWEW
jgi:hypothetical protein